VEGRIKRVSWRLPGALWRLLVFLFKRALLVLFGIVLALVIGEVYARLTYEAPWYDQLIGEQTRRQKYPNLRNQYGLRDRNYPEPKPGLHRRVLILGDSFTRGSGVLDTSAIFPELLESRLKQGRVLPGVENVDVLNGGIGGSLTQSWLELLSRVRDSYQPDVVLVVFFLRDGTSLGTRAAFFNPIRKEIAQRNGEDPLYRHVYLYRLVRDNVDRMNIAQVYASEIHKAYLGDGKQTREWRQAQTNILKMKQLASEGGVVLGLVVFPILVDLGEGYPFRLVCDAIAAFGKENEIAVHDLRPAFKDERAPELWVSPFDQHPNERAHAIAAQSIYPFLLKLLQAAEELRK
jgi:lysophospholipase L1-like esterase